MQRLGGRGAGSGSLCLNGIARVADHLRRPGPNLLLPKVLLLVLDGLSLSQWKAIKVPLQDQLGGIAISEDQCFTLVPSLTNICRQAIYSGELPVFFENTIQRTDCDGKRWKAFWECLTTKVEGYASGGHFALHFGRV